MPSSVYRHWDFTFTTGVGSGNGFILMPLTWAAFGTNAWVSATATFTLPHQVLDNAGPTWVEVTSYTLTEDRTSLLYDGGNAFDRYVVYVDNVTLRSLPGGPNLEVNGTFDTDNTGWELFYSANGSSSTMSAVFGGKRVAQPGPYKFQQGLWMGRTGVPADYNVQDAHVIAGSGGADLPYLILRQVTAGYFMPIFRFDLTTLAPHVGRVTNATLTLTVSDNVGFTVETGTHFVYAFPSGNTTWVESTAKGDVQSTGVPWALTSGSPAASAAAAAVDGTLLGSRAFASAPAIGSTVVFSLDTAAVNAWLANPAGYAGFAIIQPGPEPLSQVRYHSSEAAVATNRPLLEVSVPPVGTTVRIH